MYGPRYGSYDGIYAEEERKRGAALKKLRERGAEKVEVRFSGGNDEGGPDGMDLLDGKGLKIGYADYEEIVLYALTPVHKKVRTKSVIPEFWRDSENPEMYRERVPIVGEKIEGDEARALEELLSEPIYVKYGGFADEYRVCGTLVWDTSSGKHDLNETQRSADGYHDD